MSSIRKPTPLSENNITAKSDSNSLINTFSARATKELIIGFVGPIGCGMKTIIEDVHNQLIESNYDDVIIIKLSKCLQDLINEGSIPSTEESNNESAAFKKYRSLQEAGKFLRSKTANPAVLAEYAVKQIGINREQKRAAAGDTEATSTIPNRVAYLIDQIKRPEEVEILRAVYRDAFYLVGVTRVYDRRVSTLKQEKVREGEIQTLMEIDRQEENSDGQRIDKTLFLADYFLRNDKPTTTEKSLKIKRMLHLMHGGSHSITPTDAEQGMYAAYAAGMRSACLSRQVGAAITSQDGKLLATGCNDVPRAGGGLYSSTNSSNHDMRCVHREEQHCFNDFYKNTLRQEIGDEIGKYLGSLASSKSTKLSQEENTELIDLIYKNTRLKDLIEFSRAVHAEMDAIISIGRQGIKGLESSILFTTTFPCHNCARHIVAAGIMKVYYIEPYEKSMARSLHDDAIDFDVDDATDTGKVKFLHFEGVSPKQFHNFFKSGKRKDTSGRVIKFNVRTSNKILPEYLDSYQDFEAKATKHHEEEIDRFRKQQTPN